MLGGALCLLLLGGLASCSVKCPDGNVCSDSSSCCRTRQGYSCCPYPRAACCSDLAHCCPEGYTCNLATMFCEKAGQPWRSIPMAPREAAEDEVAASLQPLAPSVELKNSLEESRSSVVYCDHVYTCPDRTTCCRHPRGAWFCCPYFPGRCCADGFHCCPYGYDCDLTYTHCVRQSLRYPFPQRQALSSFPALSSPPEEETSPEERPAAAMDVATGPEGAVIRCDSKFYCPAGKSCCRGTRGQWSCCPFKLGQCCADGSHCCDYGYNCNPTSTSCTKQLAQTL